MTTEKGARLVFFLCIVLTIDACSSREPTVEGPQPAGGTPPAAASRQVSRSPSTPPVAPPIPHKIKTSGRLPTQVQGFALGNSLGEAIRQDPTLVGALDGKRPDANALEALLTARSFGRPNCTLLFEEGFLLEIDCSVGSISPADAEQFEKDTLRQLGPPDMQPVDRPDLVGMVWIDGDVRIHFSNHELIFPTTSREVSLSVVDYAYHMNRLSKSAEQWVVQQEGRRWGELIPRPGSRPLPTQLGEIRLGMEPFEVRRVMPGVRITSLPGGQAQGEITLPNRNNYNLGFWHGRLTSLISERYDVNPAEFGATRDRMIREFGEPDGEIRNGKEVDWLIWNDGKVRLDFQTHLKLAEYRENSGLVDIDKPWVLEILGDQEARRQADMEKAQLSPPKFKDGPAVKSFF